MPKIITVIPVKNDGWFIENSIKSALEWSDHVFVADDNSDDGSHEIYKKLEKNYKNLTIIYDRPKVNFNSPDIRNYILDLARSFDGNNLIFELHADEIMSAKILDKNIREKLLNDMTIGSALIMPWTNLWGEPFYFRNDKSVWSNNKSWFAYRDDRNVRFTGATFHGPRAPESFLKNRIDISYLQVMHFQFINLAMERSKQALYQIFERNHYPSKNIEHINKSYACAFDERNINLTELDKIHYNKWLEKGIQIDKTYSKDGYNWRDSEVLKNFNKYGISTYKDLNIWYIDWELKRQEAIKLGLKNIPDEIVLDPRSLSTKLAHTFLMKYQLYPFWRIAFYNLLIEKGLEKINRRLFG